MSLSQRLPETSDQVNPKVLGKIPPYTCLNDEKRCQVSIRKCRCGHAWCPTCWDRGGKKDVVARMGKLNWEKVRHIVLTVDRDKFDGPENSFDYLTEKRAVGNFIRNLERTDGIKINDWIASLQWHDDGYPHWHILIEVEKKGRAGMIGFEILRKRWPYGFYIRESYVTGEKHWKRLLGYLNVRGYFEGGGSHQGELPDWAKDSGRRIKRYETMKSRGNEVPGLHRDKISVGDRGDDIRKLRSRTNREIIESCGMACNVSVNYKGDELSDGEVGKNIFLSYEVKVPYKVVLEMGQWGYVEFKGMVRNMSLKEYRNFNDWLSDYVASGSVDKTFDACL